MLLKCFRRIPTQYWSLLLIIGVVYFALSGVYNSTYSEVSVDEVKQRKHLIHKAQKLDSLDKTLSFLPKYNKQSASDEEGESQERILIDSREKEDLSEFTQTPNDSASNENKPGKQRGIKVTANNTETSVVEKAERSKDGEIQGPETTVATFKQDKQSANESSSKDDQWDLTKLAEGISLPKPDKLEDEDDPEHTFQPLNDHGKVVTLHDICIENDPNEDEVSTDT